jgi:hypothetical protein
MHARPLSITVASVLLALLSLMNFPGPWWPLLAGTEEQPPAFVIYSGMVLGIVGLVAAVGLWLRKPWSLWTTLIVCVLNLLAGAPGVVMGANRRSSGRCGRNGGIVRPHHRAGTATVLSACFRLSNFRER